MDPQTTGETEQPALDIKVGIENGNVVVLFNQSITTLGLPPEAAKKMGRALIKKAKMAKELTKS